MLKLGIVIFLCVLAQNACDQKNEDQIMDTFRLPDNTKPSSYELKFIPKFDGLNSTFSGETKINITIIQSTRVITLNLKDLNVTNVKVYDITTKRRELRINDLKNITKNEQFEIYLNTNVPPNRNLEVDISYNGKIRNDMSGLYLSSYQDDSTKTTKWMAVTQFEATSARKAFPCYDEPSYKAKFKISVVKQKNQIALSNMPIAHIANVTNDTDIVYFDDTPIMSTYFTAIYVGEFVANKNDSPITIYTQKDYINQTGYVSNNALKHLNQLENYTDIKYDSMLPKMDLLAIPDFDPGAMENWGINTYRENYILLHEESKTKMKIRSSVCVQHEFTHQWFGNLVTCAWWDYLWLNEGFARYFQYFATGVVKPSWKMEELFVTEIHQVALEYDQKSRHPITSLVNTPQEIDNIFDLISYNKAACVLRMLNHIVNETIFQKALQEYLTDNSYSVATPENLFTAFDNVLLDYNYELENGLTITEFMTNWTTQSGYPLLTISKNKTSNEYSLIQDRFLIDANEKNNSNSSSWIIGLTFTNNTVKNFTSTKPTIWTDKISNVTVIKPLQNFTGDWYIFNIQSTGFYRVNYDSDNWKNLIKQLNTTPTDIHVLNRAQLIDDAFTLARAGLLSYTVPLQMSQYLKKENDSIPWYTAMNQFSYLIQRLPRSEQYNNFKAHVSRLAGIKYKQLEELVAKGNREFVVLSAWDKFSLWACNLENEYSVNKGLEYFEKWQRGEKISADIKDAAFCMGVKNSNGSSTFNKMLNLYKTTKSISEKLSIELALGCSTNRTQLEEYINHIFDGPQGPIKAKDYESVILSISKTPLGLDVLYEFLSKNMNRTINELSDGEDIVKFIYLVLSEKITNDSEIEKVKYLKDNTTIPESIKSSFDESYEHVNHNLLWFNTYSNEIDQWALEYKEEDEPISTTMESPKTTVTTTTTMSSITTSTMKPSSATSNSQNNFITLLFTMFTVLIAKCIF